MTSALRTPFSFSNLNWVFYILKKPNCVNKNGKCTLSHLITGRVDLLLCTFGLECQVANHIFYDRQSKVKPWLDSIVYQLINVFGSVEHSTAQAACNFVYLFRKNLIYFEEAIFHSPTGSALLCIQPIIVTARYCYHVNQSNFGNSCGLYLFFSSVTYTGSLYFYRARSHSARGCFAA